MMQNAKRIMIDHHLRKRGIHKKNVLQAFKTVNREDYLPPHLHAYTYDDSPLPIEDNQTISQPFIVALMVQALDPSKTKNVLEIGTGSGYQTAILAELFNHVYTVEYHERLFKSAQTALTHYTNITFKLGDGKEGFFDAAPFDAIVVSAASKTLPKALNDQLKETGRLVIPLGSRFMQVLTLHIKKGDTLTKTSLGGCRFVPLL